jgi:hypothetical protein
MELPGRMADRHASERPAAGSLGRAGAWCDGVSIMAQPEAHDHDQRLKVLIKEFFEAFFVCFFPQWAARFEFVEIDWLDKEVFLAPPQGERRQLDLIARLKLRPDAPPPREGVTDLVALVHLEVESSDSSVAFQPRMFDYYIQLRRDTGLPVLPIALFLRLGLKGVGWDSYVEQFWEHPIIRFNYAYVGLPALDGEPYATGENLVGVALSTLMRLPAARRAELYAEGLKRIAGSGQNAYRQMLLAECLEAYAELDETEKKRLHAEAYPEVQILMKTTYERGIEQGIEQGIERGIEQGIERGIEQGERRLTLRLIEAKFGPLSPQVKQQVEALSPHELARVQLDLLKAESLQELGLND